jgi:phosphoglycerate dehydrogenase-like enzyme
MKMLVIGNQARYEKFLPKNHMLQQLDVVFCPLGTADAVLLEKAADAEILVADAIARVGEDLIASMPNLKLIQSEGVGYNGIHVDAATKRDIPVCNNKGINAAAVAEQTILLMLSLLRDFREGDQAVREGLQIQKKESMMIKGFLELSECSVGLIGLGDIGKIMATLLAAFGSQVYYYETRLLSKEDEEKFKVSYLPLDELLARCNIVSLHVPVTPQTENMVNEGFLRKMRTDAWLINTARGELVDNVALRKALEEGWIQGAGLDTVAPEPTTRDNVMVDLPEELQYKVVYSPHIAGVSTGTFRRAHEYIWENVRRIVQGEDPLHRVNG